MTTNVASVIGRARRPVRWPWYLWGVCLAAALLFLMHRGAGNTFFLDEWGWIEFRRAELAAALRPYNGHLELVPTLVYQLLFRLIGLRHYWVFRLLAAIAHLACATAVFVYAGRRLGAVGLLVAVPVAVLGAGWEFILWGVNFGFTVSIALGVGALLALDRDDRRGDLYACAMLVVGLAFTEYAAFFAFGALVELWRLDRRMRWVWVAAVPIALYVLWWLVYQQHQPLDGHLLTLVRFVIDLAASAAGGLFGQDIFGAGVLPSRAALVVVAAAVVWRCVRHGAFTRRLLALLVVLGLFWVVVALGRAQMGQPYLSRYQYTGVILIVLILAEAFRGARVTAAAVAAVCIALAAVALIGNVYAFDGGERYLRGSRIVAAELTGLGLAHAVAPARFVLDPHYAPQIFARRYFAAVRAIGSTPADTVRQLTRAPERERLAADRVLIRAGELSVRVVRTAGSICRPLTGHVSIFRLAAGRRSVCLSASSPTTVRLGARRFASSASGLAVRRLRPGERIIVSAQPDVSAVPWYVRVSSVASRSRG